MALLLGLLIRSVVAASSLGTQLRLPWGIPALLATVFVALCLASTSTSVMPTTSWWFAWILSAQMIAFLVWRSLAHGYATWRTIDNGLSLILATLSIWAIAEFLETAWRANGPFLDYNAFGALLYLLIVPQIATIIGESKNEKSGLAWCSSALGILALFTTQSRGATAVFLLASLVLALAALRSNTFNKRAALKLAALSVAAYTFSKLYPATLSFRPLDLASDPSTSYRLMMWKSAWQAFLDHPWTGTGLGTYKLEYLHYRLPTEIGSSGDLAHCDYIQLLMEGGPILLAALLAWGIYVAALAKRLWNKLNEPNIDSETRRKSISAFALLIAVLGLFLHAAVNFIFYVLPISIIAGLYIAQAQTALKNTPPKKIDLGIHPIFAAAIPSTLVALCTLGMLIDWGGSISLNNAYKFDFIEKRLQDPTTRYRLARLILAARPNHVSAHEVATKAATDLALENGGDALGVAWAEIALDEAKDWQASSRGNPFVLFHTGQLLWRYPSLQSAMSPDFPDRPDLLFKAAIDRYHNFASAYLVAARYYEDQNAPQDAFQVLASGLPWMRLPVPNGETVIEWQKLLREGRRLAELLKEAKLPPELKAAQDEFLSLDFNAGH